MNRKIFTSILSIGFIAGLAACSSGDGDSTARKEAFKRNDLETIENSLASMMVLDAADSTVRSAPVPNLEAAQQMFRCIVAESCSYNEESKSLSMTLEGSRLETLENGNIEYKMSDQFGVAQGTVTFIPMASPEKGILGYIEISANGSEKVQKLNFVDKGAWPENGGISLNCRDLVKWPTLCNFINAF